MLLFYLFLLHHFITFLICLWKDTTKYHMPRAFYSTRWFHRMAQTDVLIHAVSCGEAMAMVPVMAYLSKQNIRFTLSVHTYTGYTLMKKIAPDISLVLKPLDTFFTMALFFAQLQPKCIIISESDTWPCLLILAKVFRIPIFYMNYKYKPEKPLRNWLHRAIATHIYTQNAYRNDDRYTHIGNLKYLAVKREHVLVKSVDPPTIIIASAGQDEILIHLNYIKAFPNVRFIYVPRHLSWDVKPYFNQLGRDYTIITKDHPDNLKSKLIVCLGYGMLNTLYQKANICLMGDTFNSVGGHNLIEPAIAKNAIILGPVFHTCKEVADMLNISHVASEIDLWDKTQELLENRAFTKIGEDNRYRIFDCRAKIKCAFKSAMPEILAKGGL
jgi:3-deoxy-D-manno-octulosonic-acid transferase